MPRFTAVPDEDELWRMRWLLLASTGGITFGVVTLVATQPTDWHWTLLAWGVLIGIVYTAYLLVVFAAVLRREQHSAEQRTRFMRRRLIYVISALFFCTVAGVIAAAFDVVWIDLVLAAYLALIVAASVVGLVVLNCRNRQE